EQLLWCTPGMTAAWIHSNGEILDHSDRHSRCPCRLLHLGKIAIGQPLVEKVSLQLAIAAAEPRCVRTVRVLIRSRPMAPVSPSAGGKTGVQGLEASMGEKPWATVANEFLELPSIRRICMESLIGFVEGLQLG